MSNFSLRLITPPDEDPVSLAEAKAHLRVDDTDSDDLITSLISAATQAVDGAQGYLGRALMTQTWDYFLNEFPYYGQVNSVGLNNGQYYPYVPVIDIPLPPLVSVTGVYYRGANGVEQTLNPASYQVDAAGEPGKIYLPVGGAWPVINYGPSAVRIRFVAGVDDTDDVPKIIKQAILIYVGDLFEQRESMTDQLLNKIPWTAEQLLRKHKFYLSAV